MIFELGGELRSKVLVFKRLEVTTEMVANLSPVTL